MERSESAFLMRLLEVLTLISNHHNRAYLIFVSLIQFTSVNLSIFPISLWFCFLFQISVLVCVESRCFLIARTFYPSERLSVVVFVPFKAGDGPFQSGGVCLPLALENFIVIIIIIIFHGVCSVLWGICWTSVGPDLIFQVSYFFFQTFSLSFLLCSYKIVWLDFLAHLVT